MKTKEEMKQIEDARRKIENLDLVTWRGARKHKRKYKGEKQIYTQEERLIDDFEKSAKYGFTSYVALLGFYYELNVFGKDIITEDRNMSLKEFAKLNTENNLEALGYKPNSIEMKLIKKLGSAD